MATYTNDTTASTGTGTGPDSNNEDVRETRGLCLLSLDGGGVRGLSTLYILRGIMNRLNDKREEQGLQRVRPCNIFDLIGGTSTGGYARLVPAATYMTRPLTGQNSLIAIMLGRLEMTVEECITEYETLMRTVFAKEESRVRILPNGVIKPRFSSKVLAQSIQGVVRRANIAREKPVSINEPFYLKGQDGSSRRCRV